MVRRRLALGALLVALTTPVVAADQTGADGWFAITTGAPQYGRPINIELHAAPGSALRPDDLDHLDLTPLDRDFVVEPRAGATIDAEIGAAMRPLRLHPRRAGDLPLPELSLAGASGGRIAAGTLSVAPALDRKDRSPLTVSHHVDSPSVWVHQGLRVRMAVESRHANVRLAVTRPEFAGIEVESLAETRETVVRDGIALTRLEIGWRLYPTRAGRHALQLPAVEFRREGAVTHRFPPPRVELTVRELPAFVPPSLPVGRIEIDAVRPGSWLLARQELAFLELRIRTDGAAQQTPYQVLRQLQDTEDVTFYPPELLPADASEDGHTRRYRVPFKPTGLGLIDLPRLRVQFFDPESGKIVTHFVSLGRVPSLPASLIHLGTLLLVAAGLWVLRSALRALARYRRRRHAYRAAREAVAAAAVTPAQLRAALALIAEAEAWPANLTVTAWLEHWHARHPSVRVGSEVALGLREALYGRAETQSLAALQTSITAMLRDASGFQALRRTLGRTD